MFMASCNEEGALPFLSLTIYSFAIKSDASPRGIINGAGSESLVVGLANTRGRRGSRHDKCILSSCYRTRIAQGERNKVRNEAALDA